MLTPTTDSDSIDCVCHRFRGVVFLCTTVCGTFVWDTQLTKSVWYKMLFGLIFITMNVASMQDTRTDNGKFGIL